MIILWAIGPELIRPREIFHAAASARDYPGESSWKQLDLRKCSTRELELCADNFGRSDRRP